MGVDVKSCNGDICYDTFFCSYLSSSGEAPNGQLEVFLDEHFDNARMERIYPNAKKVTKAE